MVPFSANDICRLFGSSKVAATFLLHRYSKKGYITRLKQNLYVLPDFVPPEPLLANRMVSPSYVSLEFALSYHQIIPETVYEITSITTKSTRRFEAAGKRYTYRSIQKKAFTGYGTARQQGFSFLIADPEKAYVDSAYFNMRDRLEPNPRADKKKLDWKKVRTYASLFGHGKLNDWIEREKP